MSSNSFAATIDLTPRPSVRALLVLFVLHAAAALLGLLALPTGLPMIVWGIAVASSWLWVRRHAALGFGPRALVRLTWHADGGWTLHDGAGRTSSGTLQGTSYVHPRLLALSFRTGEGGRRSRLLLGDEVEPEQLRRLRARLSVVREAPAS